jgi:hypothetical protein
MRIHPISGHLPWSYKFLPDSNLSLENEDMSRKMRMYGTPMWRHYYNMKMEAADSSKPLAPIYLTSCHHSLLNRLVII